MTDEPKRRVAFWLGISAVVAGALAVFFIRWVRGH
jgi:hypothetical protein